MTEEINSNSAVPKYFDHVIAMMEENEKFLRKKAEATYEEVIKLNNNALDKIGLFMKREDRKKEYIEHSMAFFTYHVLMPCSCAIYIDLLVSNIPACFMTLRMMLESLAKCYLADLHFSERPFFRERLRLLEQEKISTSKLMQELGTQIGIKKDFVSLWGKLSKDWLHTEGFMDKLITHIIDQSDMPRWSLAIPINYMEGDLSILEELRKRVSQFRSLLAITMEQYRH